MSDRAISSRRAANGNVAGVRLTTALRTLGMLPVLLLLSFGFFMASDRFLTAQNISIVLQQAAINTVLASGMTFVILTAGIDLSVGSILAAAAMTSVWITLVPGFEHFGIAAGLLTSLVFGLVNGVMVAVARLPPFIVTLGMLTAVRGIARLIGHDKTLINTELPFAYVANTALFGVHSLVLLALVFVLISWWILRFTVLGIRIYAVGGNASAARLAGIRVWLVLLFVYAYSGLMSGVGGLMSAAKLYSANGLQLGQAYELDAIAAVILGGTSFVGGIGSIWGTVVGAMIIAVLTNGLILTGVPDIYQYIIKGVVIVAAVAIDRLRLPAASGS
ncbi:ribose ABC transporter permease [Mesorhizobium sp. CGMCC 1.15528]|uniref:Ribose ABC transporter permease n=1 Tax=Mesorhizobium zhangyense TaxID=1776730 RepID=A0A7C9VDE7_9HYPH|nr:ribose ABC transporter permease [Mesorhizobium zhangyense]NGN44666.1 ribose ABC transporter permease [Mesorhizobium zhangyense]